MDSLPEDPVAFATARIWNRQAYGSPAIQYASALIGIDVTMLMDAVALSVAASDEARALLDSMPLRIRTLTTKVVTQPERCVNSVRGPVLWSETITARANAFGNDDVFICATSLRSFDTVENRVLAAALEELASAERALNGDAGAKVPDEGAAAIAAVSAEAREWRDHARLRHVRGGRLSARDTARLRGGHRIARMAPVMAIRDRMKSPFVSEDLTNLADEHTRAYHGFVERVIEEFVARDLLNGVFSFSDGGLWSGALSWRHPAADGRTGPGLCYRGVPMLPPLSLTEGAPWHELVPPDGVRIVEPADIDRLLERLSSRPIPARRTQRGSSMSSSSARTGS